MLSGWYLGFFEAKEWTERDTALNRKCSWSLMLKISDSKPVLRENQLKAGSPSVPLEVQKASLHEVATTEGWVLDLIPATEYLFPNCHQLISRIAVGHIVECHHICI